MSRDIFTAGIARGGLTTDYEIRILVCWLLSQLDSPVTLTQLNAALQQDELVNYFELTRAVGSLLDSGHLLEQPPPDGRERVMVLTDLGVKTAQSFAKAIPLTVREKSLASTRHYLLRERLEKENRVEIEETRGGFNLRLTIADVGSDLLHLDLYVPTKAMCEEMKQRFLDDPTVLYRAVVTALTGQPLELPPEQEPND